MSNRTLRYAIPPGVLALITCALLGTNSCKERAGDPLRADAGQAAVIDASVGPLGAPPPKTIHAHSLIQLLAQPERMDGAQASISGFLVIEESQGGIGGAIHLDRDDWRFGLTNNVPLRFGPCQRSSTANPLLTIDEAKISHAREEYAIVRGTFEADRSVAGGVMCAITSITKLRDLSEGSREKECPPGRR